MEAERRQKEEKQHDALESVLRRKAIKEQHGGKGYTQKELSGRLWELVRASEALKSSLAVDEDVEQPAQTDTGATQVEAGASEAVTAPEFDNLPVAEPVEPQKYRRKAVFEDLGVSQQAAWCAPPKATIWCHGPGYTFHIALIL